MASLSNLSKFRGEGFHLLSKLRFFLFCGRWTLQPAGNHIAKKQLTVYGLIHLTLKTITYCFHRSPEYSRSWKCLEDEETPQNHRALFVGFVTTVDIKRFCKLQERTPNNPSSLTLPTLFFCCIKKYNLSLGASSTHQYIICPSALCLRRSRSPCSLTV